MKLRLATEHIRFRISRSEFDALTNSQVITAELSLPSGSRLQYTIKPDERITSPDGTALDFESSSGINGMIWNLTVYRNAIDMLIKPEHAKNGVKEILTFGQGDMLTVSLEIDIDRRAST
jgi:hypothetical protein